MESQSNSCDKHYGWIQIIATCISGPKILQWVLSCSLLVSSSELLRHFFLCHKSRAGSQIGLLIFVLLCCCFHVGLQATATTCTEATKRGKEEQAATAACHCCDSGSGRNEDRGLAHSVTQQIVLLFMSRLLPVALGFDWETTVHGNIQGKSYFSTSPLIICSVLNTSQPFAQRLDLFIAQLYLDVSQMSPRASSQCCSPLLQCWQWLKSMHSPTTLDMLKFHFVFLFVLDQGAVMTLG